MHRLWESFTPVNQKHMRRGLALEDRALSDDQLALRDRQRRATGTGLGVAFGEALADVTGREIGLIPAAQGGATLEKWNPSHLRDGIQSLYGAMIARIDRARSTAPIDLAGVLWYQGESDGNASDSATYSDRFDSFITAVRHDLGNPVLPVYVVQLGRLALTPSQARSAEAVGDPAAWDTIREAQRTLPSRHDHVGVVSAVDLDLFDPIHIDSAALMRLARRLARLAVTGGSGPDVVRIERIGNAANGLVRITLECVNVIDG